MIPYAGVLGGKMHFRTDEIIVLSHEWVFAPFDDGHTGGFLLLTYAGKLLSGRYWSLTYMVENNYFEWD